MRAPVPRRATEPLPTPLGTLEAIHHATTLTFCDGAGVLPVVAIHDGALGVAARASGFDVRGL